MDWESILELIAKNGVKILISLVALFICFKVINAISKRLQKQFSKSDKLDKSTVRTLIYIGKILLKIRLGNNGIGFFHKSFKNSIERISTILNDIISVY